MSFETHHKGSLEYLTAQTLRAVRHCFSTRYGGVSEGHLASLNLGTNRGDRPEHVRENYARLCRAIGIEPTQLVFARQTHSDDVARVTAQNCGEGLLRPVPEVRDALITNDPNAALVVFSADCAPVLLYDPVHQAIGAVHSGWRGTAQGIAYKTVRAMQEQFGTDPADLCAAIGPSIGVCCFETHQDVPDAMRAALGEEAECAIHPHGDKYYVNNQLLIQRWLLRAGLRPAQIDCSEDCTACQPNRFWSYRKVGDARGALASIIQLPDPKGGSL